MLFVGCLADEGGGVSADLVTVGIMLPGSEDNYSLHWGTSGRQLGSTDGSHSQ